MSLKRCATKSFPTRKRAIARGAGLAALPIIITVAVAVTLLYLVAGTILLPSLWAEPLGPLLKTLPVLALNFVALAILEDR